FVAPAYEKVFHSRLVGQLLKRFLRITDGKRHQNRTRPRRDFVDVEPEPVGKQHNLRRDGRNGIVVVLAEETEVQLGEGVDLGDAAELKNFGARPLQGRCTGRVARQFETEIDFYRGADIRGPAFVDTPAP